MPCNLGLPLKFANIIMAAVEKNQQRRIYRVYLPYDLHAYRNRKSDFPFERLTWITYEYHLNLKFY